MKGAAKKVLTGKNATYAVGIGLIADVLVSFYKPEYSGVFSGIARFLVGG